MGRRQRALGGSGLGLGLRAKASWFIYMSKLPGLRWFPLRLGRGEKAAPGPGKLARIAERANRCEVVRRQSPGGAVLGPPARHFPRYLGKDWIGVFFRTERRAIYFLFLDDRRGRVILSASQN